MRRIRRWAQARYHRRRNQEGRDAHVVQTRDGAGGVITVHGAQHLVAGQRGFNRDFRGFRIANFTDHDDVRVLAQDRAQRVGEREPDFLFTGTWLMPGIWNSTGSSTVTMLNSGLLSSFSAE